MLTCNLTISQKFRHQSGNVIIYELQTCTIWWHVEQFEHIWTNSIHIDT